MLRADPATAWVFAVPSSVVTRHKQCDQLPEDYRRAGIGHCMSGDDDGAIISHYYTPIRVSMYMSRSRKAIKMHTVIMRTVPFLLIMLN